MKENRVLNANVLHCEPAPGSGLSRCLVSFLSSCEGPKTSSQHFGPHRKSKSAHSLSKYVVAFAQRLERRGGGGIFPNYWPTWSSIFKKQNVLKKEWQFIGRKASKKWYILRGKKTICGGIAIPIKYLLEVSKAALKRDLTLNNHHHHPKPGQDQIQPHFLSSSFKCEVPPFIEEIRPELT